MAKKLVTSTLMAAAVLSISAMTASAAPFDASYYAAMNPDVVAALGNQPEALQLHYETFGKQEGRLASKGDLGHSTPDYTPTLYSLFDAAYYAQANPDVVAVFGNDPALLFTHFVTSGINEGRNPSSALDISAITASQKAKNPALSGESSFVCLMNYVAEEITAGRITPPAAADLKIPENLSAIISSSVQDAVKKGTEASHSASRKQSSGASSSGSHKHSSKSSSQSQQSQTSQSSSSSTAQADKLSHGNYSDGGVAIDGTNDSSRTSAVFFTYSLVPGHTIRWDPISFSTASALSFAPDAAPTFSSNEDGSYNLSWHFGVSNLNSCKVGETFEAKVTVYIYDEAGKLLQSDTQTIFYDIVKKVNFKASITNPQVEDGLGYVTISAAPENPADAPITFQYEASDYLTEEEFTRGSWDGSPKKIGGFDISHPVHVEIWIDQGNYSYADNILFDEDTAVESARPNVIFQDDGSAAFKIYLDDTYTGKGITYFYIEESDTDFPHEVSREVTTYDYEYHGENILYLKDFLTPQNGKCYRVVVQTISGNRKSYIDSSVIDFIETTSSTAEEPSSQNQTDAVNDVKKADFDNETEVQIENPSENEAKLQTDNSSEDEAKLQTDSSSENDTKPQADSSSKDDAKPQADSEAEAAL